MSFNLGVGGILRSVHLPIPGLITVLLGNVNYNNYSVKLETSTYPQTSDECGNYFSLIAFRILHFKPNKYLILW